MTSAQSGLVLDNAPAISSATVFDGSTVRSSGYSRIHLSNGTRLDFGAGSVAQVFANRAVLQSGMSEIQSGSAYEIDARNIRVQPEAANAVARVRVGEDRKVLVTAVNAPVDVRNSSGVLVARVFPSKSMEFAPQEGGGGARPASFDQTGCILQKGTSPVLVDSTGAHVVELRGDKFNKRLIGNKARVVGALESGATPTAGSGAESVVAYASIKETSKGGCSALASKVGASTVAAAGLAAAGASAGAAAAATAAATTAGVAAGVAAAGVSTAVIVGGVAAAAAAGIGGAVAANSSNSNSP
ncbi:MAG TPA: hypothetical protein VHB50_02755 [Bryobacteraceae bacterium]|nr:hypothetical protein [Bryobacteraceae bacterium]